MSAEPPLLALARGKKVRLRKAPSIPPGKELASIHIPIASLLKVAVNPEWRWTHIGHGGFLLDPRTAARLKAMGLQAGWPDFIFIGPPRLMGAGVQVAFLELKRKGSKLSEEQKGFFTWLHAHKVPCEVADTIEAAIGFLEGLNIIVTGKR
jgi:hypothetical protein